MDCNGLPCIVLTCFNCFTANRILTKLSKGFKRVAKSALKSSELLRNRGAQDLSCPPWLGRPEQRTKDVQCVQFVGLSSSNISNSTTRLTRLTRQIFFETRRHQQSFFILESASAFQHTVRQVPRWYPPKKPKNPLSQAQAFHEAARSPWMSQIWVAMRSFAPKIGHR